MRRAILARHGESEYNVRGALNGEVAVACALTPVGVEQARLLGRRLRDEQIDLCITSEFERARETADEALRERDVARLVVRELNDPRYGSYEGRLLEEYRSWASGATSADVPGDGGESRHAIVARYARGFHFVLERPESTVLVIAHSLPIGYVLAARDRVAPSPRVELVENATPYVFSHDELERATDLLERWVAEPTW